VANTPERPLGQLISIHSTAPAYLQRAAIVAVVSFVFFLLMLTAFYIRQGIGYFVLSSAFLVVYLFTMIGWFIQSRSVVSIYENGIKYKKFNAAWGEITKVNANAGGLTISKIKRAETIIPVTVAGYEAIVQAVRQGIEGQYPES